MASTYELVVESVRRLQKAALEQEAIDLSRLDAVQNVFDEESLFTPLYQNPECLKEIWYLRGLADGLDITVGEVLDQYLEEP